MHLETKAPDEPSLVVIMPNLQALTNSERSSTFSWMEVSSLLVALYGSAFLEPVSAFEKDILVVVFVKGLVWKVFVSFVDGIGIDLEKSGRGELTCAPFYIVIDLS